MGHEAHRTRDQRPRAIGLDIGGTKIAAAVIDDQGEIHDRARCTTPPTADATAMTALLLELIEHLRPHHSDVRAVGVGVAGSVESPFGRVRSAPNSAYRDWDVRTDLSKATGLPVTVDNDANVAALAEARLVEPRRRDMVMLTVGTGIGSGIVLDGRIYRGPYGLGAEVGHIVVQPDGPLCGCGKRGCLEALASGTALARMGREAAAADPAGAIANAARHHGRPVSGHDIAVAAAAGDPTALELFASAGAALGIGIATLTAIFELEAVVIGGGLTDVGDVLLEPIRRTVATYAYAPTTRPIPPVVRANHRADAGIIGAALLALDNS